MTWEKPIVEKPYDSRFYHSADNPKSLKDVTETIDGEKITTVGLINIWLGIIRGTHTKNFYLLIGVLLESWKVRVVFHQI